MRPRHRLVSGLTTLLVAANIAGYSVASIPKASGEVVPAAGTVTLYPLAHQTTAGGGITVGPDGSLWFVSAGGEDGSFDATHGLIGRISTAGVVTYYSDPTVANPSDITVGPDGALWFTNYFGETNEGSIGRITTAGVITNYTDRTINAPEGITVGPDGALWFTNQYPNNIATYGSIGRITTAGVVTNYTSPTINSPQGIVNGPDGALWFTNGQFPETYPNNGHKNSIGRITTTGVVTNFANPTISQPDGIALGPDGALWFTNDFNSDPTSDRGSIGRITTAGIVTNFTDPTISSPQSIVAGPDGALWFTDFDGLTFVGSIGRITTAGTVTDYSGPVHLWPSSLTAGPDGALWFTNFAGGEVIGRMATTAPATTTTTSSTTTSTTVDPPPSVSVLAPALGVQLSTSVPVAWSGTDPDGIAHFDVRRSSAAWNGPMGAWVTRPASTTATSSTFTGAYGHTYCFGARAQDNVGTMSGWTASRCTAIPLRSDQLSYSSGWAKSASPLYFGGFAYYSKTHNTTMTRTGVAARKIYLVATKCASCGTVQVKWNGSVIANVSLANPTTVRKQIIAVANFSSVHTGTLTATVTSPTGKTVIIEGLAAYNT